MSPAVWFSLANTFALLGWLVLVAGLFAPAGGPWRMRLLGLAGRVWPLVLAVGYAAALATHWGSAPGGGFDSLDAVAALFRSPGNLLAGWVHYLAFDLFVGRWIVDDAQARQVPRLAVLPCLVLTFLFGPVGLLLHFALRQPLGRKEMNHAF
jgi:hypothetical protein